MSEISGAAAEPSKKANVKYGVYNQVADFAGKTVAEIRAMLVPQWGIPADAVAYNGKQKLEEGDTIPAGSQVEFHRRSGEKG